ncbi:MAG: hypothetical protein E7554_03195 [Ruminococcaceae bacterium]|nr:hypothetical protein [Oscillospiraceae bacterium]
MKSRIIIGITAVFAVLLMVFTLSGCGDSLIGKWRSTSEKETQLIFVSTGKVTMSDNDIELTGTFRDDGQNLVMSMTAPNGEKYVIEATYTIVDGELHLENSKGQVEVFVR